MPNPKTPEGRPPSSISPVDDRDIRVWLDDARPMPPGWTHHVKTANEAIALLVTGRVESISLDHDLGDETVTGTGYQVACWIEEQAWTGPLAPLEILIHSANPVGAANMRAAIISAQRAWGVEPLNTDKRLHVMIAFDHNGLPTLDREPNNLR